MMKRGVRSSNSGRLAAPKGRSSQSSNSTVMGILLIVAVCLVTMSVLPMIIVETHPSVQQQPASSNQVDVHKVIQQTTSKTRTTKDGRQILDVALSHLQPDVGFSDKPVARGVAGVDMADSPALSTAKRAHIDCDINVDSLAYWNQDELDHQHPQPFRLDQTQPEKFITFTPDRGGWNNVRMSLEIIFVIAAATGRTLVLPPKEPLYLMHHDKNNRYRGFADFFPLEQMKKHVKVITFEEYLNSNQSPPVPEELQQGVQHAADHCDKREKSKNACKHVFDYLQATGTLVQFSALHTCLVFDEYSHANQGATPVDADAKAHVETYCGSKRDIVYWSKEMNDPNVLFFDTAKKEMRLLTHYYGMIHFTNPKLDHHYKRFVRDYLHYHDAIYCAAGKIVKAVQAEAMATRNMAPDEEGAGGFSALHVRRGDLQYKKVKISAQEWYDNTAEVWQPKEILYVATDERNKTFFVDLAKHHDLRYLDDYWDLAGLSELDPNCKYGTWM